VKRDRSDVAVAANWFCGVDCGLDFPRHLVSHARGNPERILVDVSLGVEASMTEHMASEGERENEDQQEKSEERLRQREQRQQREHTDNERERESQDRQRGRSGARER
jgi:hypothetical protein